jgi:hypothetical protein
MPSSWLKILTWLAVGGILLATVGLLVQLRPLAIAGVVLGAPLVAFGCLAVLIGVPLAIRERLKGKSNR